MDLESLKKEFTDKGYHSVNFPISWAVIERAVEAYFTFLALPDIEKTKWLTHIKVNEDDRGTEVGFVQRRSSNGFYYDDKEFFHYNKEVSRFKNNLTAPPALLDFLDAAEPIYQAAVSIMQTMLHMIDPVYPGSADPTSHASILRFLKYDRAGVGDFLARGHYDRGGCSLAIAESAPGLRIGHTPNDLREVVHQEGQALFFPALFLQEKSDGAIPASWHDVIQKSSSLPLIPLWQGDPHHGAARWAVVFFAAPKEPSYFDRELVHTPKAS